MVRRTWRIAGMLILIAGLPMSIFAGVMAHVVSRFPGNAAFPADCAIVFGTAAWPVYDNQHHIISAQAGPGIQRRIAAAATLYKEGSVKKLFLSGGKGEGMPASEAAVMRSEAIRDGVPAKAITVEQQSKSTRENLDNTLPLTLDCRSVVGVSDRYHLARIELLAAQMGHPIMIYPAAAPSNAAFEFQSVIREAAGIILTLLQP